MIDAILNMVLQEKTVPTAPEQTGSDQDFADVIAFIQQSMKLDGQKGQVKMSGSNVQECEKQPEESKPDEPKTKEDYSACVTMLNALAFKHAGIEQTETPEKQRNISNSECVPIVQNQASPVRLGKSEIDQSGRQVSSVSHDAANSGNADTAEEINSRNQKVSKANHFDQGIDTGQNIWATSKPSAEITSKTEIAAEIDTEPTTEKPVHNYSPFDEKFVSDQVKVSNEVRSGIKVHTNDSGLKDDTLSVAADPHLADTAEHRASDFSQSIHTVNQPNPNLDRSQPNRLVGKPDTGNEPQMGGEEQDAAVRQSGQGRPRAENRMHQRISAHMKQFGTELREPQIVSVKNPTVSEPVHAELAKTEQKIFKIGNTFRVGNTTGTVVSEEPVKETAPHKLIAEPILNQIQIIQDSPVIQTEPAAVNKTVDIPIPDQVVHYVKFSLKDGKSSFSMKLKPEGLGELSVKMTMVDGKVSLDLNTSLPSTKAIITNQLGELRQALEQNSIRISDFNVSCDKELSGNLISFDSFKEGHRGNSGGQDLYREEIYQEHEISEPEKVAVNMRYYNSGLMNYRI